MATLDKVSLDIQVVLGTTDMPVHQVLRLGRGAIIELDASEDDEVRILANNFPVAKGTVVVQRQPDRGRGQGTAAAARRHALIVPPWSSSPDNGRLTLVTGGSICYMRRRFDARPFGRRPLQMRSWRNW